MTAMTSPSNTWGPPKTIWQSGCRPVAVVRTQKPGIKYKKPVAVQCCARANFRRRSARGESWMLIMGRGRPKVWRLRGRTGRFMTHFFTQNPGNIFFKGHCFAKQIEEIELKKVSQINDGVFEKTSRNSGGRRVAQ